MKHKFLCFPVLLFMLILLACCLESCKKFEPKISTTDDVNIVGYLERNRDSFSLFKQILDRTETSSFLDAYGSYTVFAPTNSAVKTWLSSIGAPSVEAANLNTLKDIVKFHILADTLTSASFKDGKLSAPTMFGQFLITGVISNGGISSYSINRQATVLQTNIRVGNGFIHVIDHVLEPARFTIAQELEANVGYSIFVQAMKETGFFNLLNAVNPDLDKRWKTVLAESNKALADSGITSYAALRARYSQKKPITFPPPQDPYLYAPTNPLDSLNLYMAYHIVDGIKFLGDIITAPSYLTLQPQEVISVKLINNEVLINEDEFNGVLEKGVLLTRNNSDNAATNGVWHNANAHFTAKFRKPTALYWDVATFAELLKQTAFYRKQNAIFSKESQEDRPIKDIDWDVRQKTITYFYGPTSSLADYALYSDDLHIPMGVTARAKWIEFTTPPIIKGRYKVWICYRHGRPTPVIANVYVNGELMQRPISFTTGRPAGTDLELESLGWKRYTETATNGAFSGRLVGTVDLKTTEKHKVRFEAIAGGTGNNENIIDMIHFIPVNDPQWLPRFARDGTKIYQ